MSEKNLLTDAAASMKRLDKQNAVFSMKNGFLTMTLKEAGRITEHDRIFLHRAFPFEMLWEYISVLDGDAKEIGMIYRIEDFDDDTAALLKIELERKYYQPRLQSILSLKERYGFSYWNVVTTEGRNVSFTMQDTFRNIIRIGTDKAVLLDVDGNRFVIERIAALDRKSYKKIELYL